MQIILYGENSKSPPKVARTEETDIICLEGEDVIPPPTCTGLTKMEYQHIIFRNKKRDYCVRIHDIHSSQGGNVTTAAAASRDLNST